MKAFFAALLLLSMPAAARVRIGDGRGVGVWDLDEEDYVAAVTAGETGPGWPVEALKAQAVVVRTYVEKNRGRHARDGYDLCNLAHCQVYRGPAASGAPARTAAEATHGEILVRGGVPADAFFHACCGGRTASSADVWRGGTGGPEGISDKGPGGDWCRLSPDYAWTTAIDGTGLAVLLDPAWEVPTSGGPAFGARVAARDASGRVTKLLLWSGGKCYQVSGETFSMAWGRARRWNELKSAKFDVVVRGRGLVFQGKGLGHGVGLCQWGARARAESGAGYREILKRYFPGCEVRRI